MKNILHLVALTLLILGTSAKSIACDDASVTIASIVDNLNGTYTVTYNLCVEFNGLEGSPYGWTFNYNSPNTIVVQSFSPATITSSSGDVYTGAIRDGNCDASGDNVYGACDATNNLLQYYFPGFLPGHSSNTLCSSVTMTIVGYPTSVDVVTNADATSFGSCTKTVVFPPLPAPCSISTLTAGPQSACVPASNTYTQDVTVTYTSPPGSGTLNVNGQTFAISGSPQTVTLTGLTANGSSVNVTAVFSADPACTMTSNGLFTAPASCSGVPCTPDNGTWD